MRKSVENISLLQKQINDLQLENQILKNILDRSGISYTHEIARIGEHKSAEEYDPDQGARIIHPRQIGSRMKWEIILCQILGVEQLNLKSFIL